MYTQIQNLWSFGLSVKASGGCTKSVDGGGAHLRVAHAVVELCHGPFNLTFFRDESVADESAMPPHRYCLSAVGTLVTMPND